MISQDSIYNLALYLYLLSLVFSVSYFFYSSKRSQSLSLVFLSSLWAIQFLILLIHAFHSFPSLTEFDIFFLISWLFVTFSIGIAFLHAFDALFFCSQSIGFLVLIFTLLWDLDRVRNVEEIMLSWIGFVHITLAMMAYVVYTLASVCAGLYLINSYFLKRKKWNRILQKLPSLDRCQHLSMLCNLLGCCFFAGAVILGIGFHHYIGQLLWYDPRMWATMMVLVVYGIGLYASVYREGAPNKVAWWSVLAWFVLLLNYLLVHPDFTFHYGVG